MAQAIKHKRTRLAPAPGAGPALGTCEIKIDAINFRGFPQVPGNDEVLSYPDAQS